MKFPFVFHYCIRFDGIDYYDGPDTTHPHSFVELAKYDNKPFVTGSFEDSMNNNAATEKIKRVDETDVWEALPEQNYPGSTL